jgi:hypothetical protein
MNGWSAKDVTLNKAPLISVSGVVTNKPISIQYPLTSGGALHHVVKITVSGVTVAGSITAMLQTAIGNDWQNSKTVSITANGIYYIKLNVEASGDQTYLPLLNKAQIVLSTTNAGDAVTINEVDELHEL